MTAQNTAGTTGPHIERATVEQGAGARQRPEEWRAPAELGEIWDAVHAYAEVVGGDTGYRTACSARRSAARRVTAAIVEGLYRRVLQVCERAAPIVSGGELLKEVGELLKEVHVDAEPQTPSVSAAEIDRRQLAGLEHQEEHTPDLLSRVPEGTTHVTAGLRCEPAAWHYDIRAWPSGTMLEHGVARTAEQLRLVFDQQWDGRSVDLLLVRGAGPSERVDGVVYGLKPRVLVVQLPERHSTEVAEWCFVERQSEPTIVVVIWPASTQPIEAQLAQLGYRVLAKQQAQSGVLAATAQSRRPFWPVGTSDEEAGTRSPHPQTSDETWADLCRIRGRQAAAPPVLPGEEYWLVEGREGGWTAWAKLLPKCGGLCQWTAPADATKFRSRELAHQAAAVLARDVTRLEITVTSHVDVPPVAVEPKAPSEPLPGLGQAPAEADKESVEDDRLWAAINDYVRACGGDSSAAVVGWGRMDAVVAIEAALKERIKAAVSGAPKSERLQLYRVQFDGMDSYVVATSMAAAIERWKAEDPDEGDHEPDGCELVCFGGDLILPEVRS